LANIIAPPAPWTARATFSMAGEPERPHASDATEKITSPMTKTLRRPSRSPSEPEASRIAASARA
jgi:hypothetical protein